ncbi:MAG: aspartate kinase [bacterium]|nr:aspartate kinase [bacterium]
MIIMKFGGTSVGSAERIRGVAKIVASERSKQPIVVVSALSQVTNTLVELAALAAKGDRANKIHIGIERLRKIHTDTIFELQLEPTIMELLMEVVESKLANLSEILNSISALGELTPRGSDLIISFGERLSIHIVAAALTQNGMPATPIEATELIVTDNEFGNAQPKLAISKRHAKSILQPIVDKGVTPVITGFIGATSSGFMTTLGRGGSDYSATIIGYCLDASEVWIWTDVDGVMTADPRCIPSARTIAQLSYNEAAELSYFGAKVLHPKTMAPAALSSIPIFIKNTLNPSMIGTVITDKATVHPNGAKALTVLSQLSLISIQGKGMQGEYGTAAKVFGALADEKINVFFISQASSENNISLITDRLDGKRAVSALKLVLTNELRTKKLESIHEQSNVSMIAVVGEGMRNHTGIAGRIFMALGNGNINIIAIAQGSSERNISLVVNNAQAKDALQCIHDELQLSVLA